MGSHEEFKKRSEKINKTAVELHRKYTGKIEVQPKVPYPGMEYLSYYYTPGVAAPCRVIEKTPEEVWNLTNRGNTIVVLSDGTRVLGLGDIGPEAGLPVMEGKAFLFKVFGGVDAFPICVGTKDPDEIIDFAMKLLPSIGGINLEDISSPKCFYISDVLQEKLDIPVWHDDAHGTALITLSGVINALKIVGKNKKDVKIVILGAGAAGRNFVKFLEMDGFPTKNMVVLDSKGILNRNRTDLDKYKRELAEITNAENLEGGLDVALEGADMLLAASKPGPWIPKEWIKKMADDAIVFAEANPVPEILPEDAHEAGARITATGRSDFPNQINNVLGFPAVFRGALDVRSKKINDQMILAAAYALAEYAEEIGLSETHIVPRADEPEWAAREAAAVAKAAMESGVARFKVDPQEVFENTMKLTQKTMKIIDYLYNKDVR